MNSIQALKPICIYNELQETNKKNETNNVKTSFSMVPLIFMFFYTRALGVKVFRVSQKPITREKDGISA